MSQSGILRVADSILPPDVATSYVEDVGIAIPIGNVLNVFGAGGIVTSGAGNTITITGGATIATTYTANTGTASPALNNLNIFGTSVLAAGTPVATIASGNTLTVNVQLSSAAASSIASNAGLASFNSSQFTIDANGFVGLVGGASAIEKVNVQTGTSPVVPLSGVITINGAVVSAGTNPIRSDGTGANTLAIEVQISQALAAADATKIGLSNFDSARFTVDATGFVTLNGSGVAETITGDSGGALSPTAGNWNIIGGTVVAGTSPVKTAGSVSTLTINVQRSQAIASTDATKIGLASFDSADFTVDANGFVSAATTGFIKTLTGNSGGAIAPVANNINTLGTGSITISGSGSTLTTQLTGLTNHSVQVGAGTATLTQLTVGTNGQVLIGATGADPAFATLTSSDGSISFTTGANTLSLQVTGGTTTGKTITGNSGGALSPTAGNWNILGASTAAGTNPVTTVGLVSTLTINVQKAQAIASTDATKVGLANFDSSSFSVDANGFVTLKGGGEAIDSFIPDSGTNPVVPTAAGAVTMAGSGSTTTVGGTNTLTFQLTGLTNHAVLVGAGTTTITKILATATTGQIFQNNASADPSWSTATYPSTTTINQILYSSSANVVAGLATANKGVLTTGATGIPVITALATDGQLIIGSTSGVPAAATLSAGTGIVITNGSNSISIAVSGSVVAQTITGNTGGALSPTAGNWNILGTNSALTGFSPWTTGSGSTLTINKPGTAKWIVNATANLGTHTTIQAAVTAASSGETVFITPGTYTENITLKAGVNLTAFGSDSSLNQTGDVIISGTCTLTTAGSVSISGIQLQTNSAALLAVTGTLASVVNLLACSLNCTNATGITFSSSSASAAININNCTGNLGTTGIAYFSHSSAGNLNIFYSNLLNSGASTTASTCSAGTANINYTIFYSPITTSSTGSLGVSWSSINTNATNTIALTINGATTSSVNYGFIVSGSASAITVSVAGFAIAHSEVTSSNTNAITGSGTVIISSTVFGSVTKSNVTTQTGGTMTGLTQGSAPSAGFLGERISSAVSSVSLSTGVQKSLTSISLTPGIWDLSGQCTNVYTNALSTAGALLGFSSTNNALEGNVGDEYQSFQGLTVAAGGNLAVTLSAFRVTLASTTTYYLVADALFAAGTCTSSGRISATRVG